jgi:ureidoacrylate peracid hydrolase
VYISAPSASRHTPASCVACGRTTRSASLLGNLGIRQVVICGLVTDQCVESAVRHACDLGYLVTLVTDACTTHSQDRHDASLRAIRGYCRQRATAQLLDEIA